MLSHRIEGPGATQVMLTAVGECIYCRRKPPETKLTDEHIIADGLGGDLVLPASSCVDCAALTGCFEQDILRNNLRQPRGVLGIKSRKKRAKQTSFRVNVAPNDGDEPILKDIPFTPENAGVPHLDRRRQGAWNIAVWGKGRAVDRAHLLRDAQ